MFDTSMCVGGNGHKHDVVPHDVTEHLGGNDVDVRGAQVPFMHLLIACGACSREKTKKKSKDKQIPKC